MSDSATNDRLRQLERGQSELFSAIARLPVREAKSTPGVRGRIIYAQVNEVSGVGSGDPTFSFDNAIKVVGAIPAGGTGTAQNQYAQTYANNEWVLLFYSPDADQWLTERGGGTSGSQVVYFELVNDKSYADLAKLAKPVLADGSLDSGAASFNVVDFEHRFWGIAAGTNGDTEAAAYSGYRGFCLRFTDDYAEGVPGFWIIDMEGPADFIIVELTGSVSAGSAECNLVGSIDPGGGPDADRRPRIETNDYDVLVYDDLDIAGDAGTDDRWWAKWDRASEHYIFDKPVKQQTAVQGWGLVISSIPGVTITTTGASGGTWGSQASAVVLLDVDETGFTPQMSGETAITVTGLNCSKTALRGSSTEQIIVQGVIFYSGATPTHFLVPDFDLRSLPSFNSAAKQAPYHAASSSTFLLGGEDCP